MSLAKPFIKAFTKKAAKTAVDLVPKVADQSTSAWRWLDNGVKTSQSKDLFETLKANGADVLNDPDFASPGLSAATKNAYDKLIDADFATAPYKVRVKALQESANDCRLLDEIIGQYSEQTEGVGRRWVGTGPEGSKPSGADWDDYNTFERQHWAEKGKGSGLYFMHNDQEWRLDLKDRKKQTFSQKNLAEKNKENAKLSETRSPGLKLTTLDQEQFEARGATRSGGVARHHAHAAKIGEKALHQYELNLNPNWTPEMGRSAEGTKFLKNLQNRLGIPSGDMLANYRDYPQVGRKSPVHTRAHEILSEAGMNPRTISFKGMSNDEIWQFFQNKLGPTLKNIDDELGFESPYTVKSAGKAARDINRKRLTIKGNKKARKKTEPNWTGVAKKAIDGQIGKSGWDEARWRSANTQFTWSKADNRGYIDIIKDATGDDAVRTLKAQFFKEIDNLPSGTTWTLEADTAQKYRIYKRMFRDDPRFTPGGDKKLLESRGIDHFVLTIP